MWLQGGSTREPKTISPSKRGTRLSLLSKTVTSTISFGTAKLAEEQVEDPTD